MPGVITRDAARGLIIVSGGTAAAPVTCADIAAAAVAGGWSTVVSGSSSITITDHLLLGTPAAPCYFADTRKTIQLGTSADRKGLSCSGTFKLGKLVAGTGVDGCRLVLYLDSAGAASAFSGLGSVGLLSGTSFYGTSIDLYYTGSGFAEFITDGPTEWIDTTASANGTIYFAGGTSGVIRRFIPHYDSGGSLIYQYSPNLAMEDVSLVGVAGVLSGGSAATFTGINFGAKSLSRYYGALVTCNDCTITEGQIVSTQPTGDVWVRLRYTHSTQALYNGAPLGGVGIRMSSAAGQNYVGVSDSTGYVQGGLILAKQFNWNSANVLTTDDQSSKVLRLRKYGKQFIQQVATLEAKTTAQVPMLDEAVSMTAQATVAARASVVDLKQLYEVSRHYGAADLALPDPVALAGGILDFGGYAVVLSTSAAQVWAVAGNTVTVKCAASVASAADATSIKTTGTVTLAGVTAGFGIVDSAGDSYLKFTGIDSWVVYSDPARTVQIGAGTGEQLFRFVYSPGSTYYMKCVAGSTEFAMVAFPQASGETEVTLSTQALLTTLQAKMAEVKVDTTDIKASTGLIKVTVL